MNEGAALRVSGLLEPEAGVRFTPLVFAAFTVLRARSASLVALDPPHGSLVASWPPEPATDTLAWVGAVLDGPRAVVLPDGLAAPVTFYGSVVAALCADLPDLERIDSDLATLRAFASLTAARLRADAPRG